MKAIVYKKYGGPEVLQLKDVEKPIPGDNEILVKVKAVSVNPYEWHHMRGKPYFMRLIKGLFRPKNKILGNDISGIIERVGKNITEFKPGDEVFGDTNYGGLAEYVCTPGDRMIQKPDNISFVEAASIPIAGITALQGLRDDGKISKGQKVLINGASGGVGTFAVQIAKSFAVEVTGVCSTRNMELVKSIGADHVIDYSRKDFTKMEESYDMIYDAVGNHHPSKLIKKLKPEGICVVAGFTNMKNMMSTSLMQSRTKNKDRKIILTSAKPNRRDIEFLKELIETRKIKPVIDRIYPIEETPQAIRYLETMHARGKVVINVN